MALKFYQCQDGDAIAAIVYEGEVGGRQPIEPNTTDAATEKHVPVATVSGNTVDVVVGSVEHPMGDDHLITTIVLETKKGFQVVKLTAADAPKAAFVVPEGDQAVAVYEYCNLHGLWKADL